MPGTRILLVLLLIACRPYAGWSDENEIANPPWHLVDIWWDLGQDVEFESLSIDVTVHDDVDPEVRLYIAPIGRATLGKTVFYGGMQTQSDGFETFPHKQRQFIGRGGIFSRWGERDLAATRRSGGGLFESGGYEGDFISVRNTFNWNRGRYTFRWTRLDGEPSGESAKKFNWVGLFIASHERQEERFVGALRFEGEKLMLGRNIASFVEVYGKRIPLEEIPDVTIDFGNFRLQGQPVSLDSAKAVYPSKVPDYARCEAVATGVRVTVGEPVERTKRQEDLKLR